MCSCIESQSIKECCKELLELLQEVETKRTLTFNETILFTALEDVI